MVSQGERRRILHVLVVGALLVFAGPAAADFIAPGTTEEFKASWANDPAADNPWSDPNITVYIGPENVSEDNRQLVVSELRHWEKNSEEYIDGNLTFTVVEDKRRADITVTFEDFVMCGGSSKPIGCAEVGSSDEGSIYSADLTIERGESPYSTSRIIRHELGHAMGLGHSDSAEYPFMAPIAYNPS